MLIELNENEYKKLKSALLEADGADADVVSELRSIRNELENSIEEIDYIVQNCEGDAAVKAHAAKYYDESYYMDITEALENISAVAAQVEMKLNGEAE